MATPSVFITGAAAGIGRATALKFAHNGFHVGAYDVDTAGLATLSHEIQTAGGSVRAGILDVTNADQWRSAIEEFHADQGALNVLINNAGILSSGEFSEIPLARQRSIVDVNVTGTINGLHTAFPYLRDTPKSVAVNLCSASAIYGQPELATYGATKSAVRGLTEALDLEWTKHDIRVIAIWPLFVQTAMVSGMDTASFRRLGAKLTADDVAEGIWKAVHDKPLVPKVHYEIGLPATLFANAAKVSPNWALRALNRFITR
jgi:NAD(P)-dependent dehydrogenase (short-subunit alcohol dehydrogenase family)